MCMRIFGSHVSRCILHFGTLHAMMSLESSPHREPAAQRRVFYLDGLYSNLYLLYQSEDVL